MDASVPFCPFAAYYKREFTKEKVSVMIINPKETTVAYRCPACGAGVMSAVGIFALSAEMIKLKCTCGQSEGHHKDENKSYYSFHIFIPILILVRGYFIVMYVFFYTFVYIRI